MVHYQHDPVIINADVSNTFNQAQENFKKTIVHNSSVVNNGLTLAIEDRVKC